MFLVRFFKYSFQYSQIISRVNERMWKVVIYFLVLSMISIFPLNYLIVKEQGWRLDFIEESFIAETPNWNLPDNCQIRANRLLCTTNEQYSFEHRGIIYVFNHQGDVFDRNVRQVIFKENKIIYVNGQGDFMVGHGYQGFSETQNFLELNLAQGLERQEKYIAFGQSIENSFSSYIILYTLLVNSFTTIGMNALFILLLSAVLQLFRFGYSTFFTYKNSLKFLIYLMTLPALLSFGIGFLEPSFSPVFFQLGMGITTMVVMLVYGKKNFA